MLWFLRRDWLEILKFTGIIWFGVAAIYVGNTSLHPDDSVLLLWCFCAPVIGLGLIVVRYFWFRAIYAREGDLEENYFRFRRSRR